DGHELASYSHTPSVWCLRDVVPGIRRDNGLYSNFRIPHTVTYHDETCITLDAGVYPDCGYCKQTSSKYIFCRHPDCSERQLTSESVTFHTDCSNLVKKLTDGALRRFWIAATWRYPWPHSPPPLLTSEDPIDDYIRMASNACQLPLLITLSNEIKAMVVQRCGPHLSLWRYTSSIKLIKELELAQNSSIILPLVDIQSWHRGTQPRLSNERHSGIIRLTIDARGLRAICRFSNPLEPRPLSTHSSYFLYIFRQATQVYNTKVQFDICQIYSYGTPALPLGRSVIQPPQSIRTPEIERFTTSSLKQCHGLTFFISMNGIASIHPHTSRGPFSFETFTGTLTPQLQACTAWFYLPLGNNEEIVSLGLRFHVRHGLYLFPCLLVYLDSGNYTIGPSLTGRVVDITVLIKGRPILLWENPNDESNCISTIGFCIIGVSIGRTLFYSHSMIPLNNPPFKNACLTTAPLRGVVEVKLFRSQTFCRGIIPTYDNKTRRSLGQCWVGEDTVFTYQTPTRLYYASTEYKIDGVKPLRAAVYVEIATQSCPEPQKDESRRWACSAMRGIIKFWFNEVQSSLTVQETGEHEN
ncbi:unnamed protein product, partial [Clonostachys solani]